MEDALISTQYCDYLHPKIKSVAESLKKGTEDPLTIAERTFYFVRDRLIFGFDLFERKASETLQRGYGACWNKSLLLTGLLRCNRIPARFGSIPLKRTFIRPAIGSWHRLANHPYNHCLVQAYLENRWIILDPVLDKKTYETFFLPAGVEWGIDWNGRDNVKLYTESIMGPPVMHRDIDGAIKNKVANTELPKFLANFGNRMVNLQLWRRIGYRPNETVADHLVCGEGPIRL